MTDSPQHSAPPTHAPHAYDQAMAQRRAQLQTALGEKVEPVFGDHAPTPSAFSGMALPLPRRGHSNGSLIACCLLSAAASTGLTAWWFELQAPSVTDNAPRPSQSTTAAVQPPASAPPLVTPPANLTPKTPAQTPTPTTPAIADDSAVRVAAERWSAAWSKRDAAAYLAAYSRDFVPADGQPREKWAESRRRNLMSRSDISVRISQLDAMPVGSHRFRLVFLQDYRAGSYEEHGQPKTLLMVREGDEWRIAGEWQGIRDIPATK